MNSPIHYTILSVLPIFNGIMAYLVKFLANS